MLFRRDIWEAQVRDGLLYWVWIPGAVLGSGWAVDRVLGLAGLPGGWRLQVIGGVLFVAGSFFVHKAMADFARHGGTPNPRRPPMHLVKDGVYRHCRHPMFLGYDIAALGVVLMTRSTGTLVVCFPVFLLLQLLFLQKEERYLHRRYGEEFCRYQRETPLIIPFWPPGGAKP